MLDLSMEPLMRPVNATGPSFLISTGGVTPASWNRGAALDALRPMFRFSASTMPVSRLTAPSIFTDAPAALRARSSLSLARPPSNRPLTDTLPNVLAKVSASTGGAMPASRNKGPMLGARASKLRFFASTTVASRLRVPVMLADAPASPPTLNRRRVRLPERRVASSTRSWTGVPL